ncbi:MAG: CbiX/SirB N-terminal domain-containing protein [Nocardioides sp.]|uniref:sirohydrochlorin chelatase n=1 Tax=Nocardioides sp. TaxID=35761 RepID=UPI0039E6527B
MTVAHGTRHETGNAVAAELTRLAGGRLGLESTTTYVELCRPLFADAIAATPGEVVVVPLLLSRGYHVAVDLPKALLAGGEAPLGGRGGPTREMVLAPPLGPHPLLARAQASRLIDAGAVPGDPVVMIAAGSRDPRAAEDLAGAADLLTGIWGARVRVAVLSGEGARPADVIEPGDVVSTYLLSPGHFATRAAEEARASGAVVVADVLGAHPLLVELICERASARLHTEVH